MEHNDTNNITAEDLSRDLQRVIFPVSLLIAFEIAWGIVGNILILIVYLRHYKECNFRCFVLCMAAIDLLSSVTTLPGEFISHMNWYSYKFDTLCKVKSFFNVYTVWASGLVLLILAYDRNRKICHPLSWQIPTRIAGRLCITCLVISLVVSFPIAIFWGKQSYVYTHKNVTIEVSICEKSDRYAHDQIPFIFVLFALVVPLSLIMATTTALNICTVKKLLMGMKDCTSCRDPAGLPAMNSTRKEPESHLSHENTCSVNGDVNTNGVVPPVETPLKAHRRYSFPTSRNTWKQKQLHTRHEHRVLMNGHIGKSVLCANSSKPSELDSDQCFCQSPGQLYACAAKSSRRKHVSNIDVTASTPKHIIREWRENYIRHRNRSRRTKTVIMLMLSTVFILTTSTYLVLITNVADPVGVLQRLSNKEKVTFLLFLRLYYINTFINPILYGCMDERFRKGLKRICLSTKPQYTGTEV